MTKLSTLLKNDGKERSLYVHTPTIEAFVWLVLNTDLIPISQTPTHAHLDLVQVMEKAK